MVQFIFHLFGFPGDKEIIGYLLSNGAKGDDLSPFMCAARDGNFEY